MDNRVKELLNGIISFLPGGGIINNILNIMWPQGGQVDIWSLIEDRVKGLIDKAILELLLNERKTDIDGLRKLLAPYVNAASNEEKGQTFGALVAKARSLQPKFTDEKHEEHLIPLTTTFALCHIGVLIEQVRHANEFETFNPAWVTELKDTYSEYLRFFEKAHAAYKAWRESQIEVKWWRDTKVIGNCPAVIIYTAYGSIRDKLVSGREWKKQKTDSHVYEDHFKGEVLAQRDKWVLEDVENMNKLSYPARNLQGKIDDIVNEIESVYGSSEYCGPAPVPVSGSIDGWGIAIARRLEQARKVLEAYQGVEETKTSASS